MTNKSRILLVGAQHGNERLGPRFMRHLAKQPERYPEVDYLCGNPKAYRANIRFIETDLNRSYNPHADTVKTYEAIRAQKILRRIRDGSYEYVLDIHTSYTDVDRFFLAASMNEAVYAVVGASTLSRLVIMPTHIADCSLIGQVPQAISIEYNRDLARTATAVDELTALLDNLLAGRKLRLQREVFPVREKIAMNIDLPAQALNFQKTHQGFYPVLIGPNTYKGYKGFAAYERQLYVM